MRHDRGRKAGRERPRGPSSRRSWRIFYLFFFQEECARFPPPRRVVDSAAALYVFFFFFFSHDRASPSSSSSLLLLFTRDDTGARARAVNIIYFFRFETESLLYGLSDKINSAGGKRMRSVRGSFRSDHTNRDSERKSNVIIIMMILKKY